MPVTAREWLVATCTPDEKQKLRIAAAYEGISMSEYIRRAVFERIEQQEDNDGRGRDE